MVQNEVKAILGRAEKVLLPELFDVRIHARIDTGARKSTIWVSRAEVVDGELEVIFFDKGAEGYTGKVVKFKDFDRLVVASSNGHMDSRFTIKALVKLGSRKIRATFTLADRSSQVYPILIGRNVLRGKFIVDVQLGKALIRDEKLRISKLQENLNKEEAS